MTDKRLDIGLHCGGAVATRVKVDLGDAFTADSTELDTLPANPREQPLELNAEQLPGRRDTLPLFLDPELAARLFPDFGVYFSEAQLATVLATTRLVGMECPGLHSIYSRLSLTFETTASAPQFSYEVTRFDSRFDMASIDFAGAHASGEIQAFLRPLPQQQADFAQLKGLVDCNKFRNQRALVIGGSRGLGEVCVKLLAAGGADVRFSYYKGRGDADRLEEEIGSGAAQGFHYDVSSHPGNFSSATQDGWQPTHLYFFATPFIFGGVKNQFSPELYDTFNRYYVTGFWQAVDSLASAGALAVFYPSTVAIDELPPGLAEYTASKLASEATCDYLCKKFKELKIYKPRLPRLATDQTATNMPVASADPVDLMLEHLEAFCNESPVA